MRKNILLILLIIFSKAQEEQLNESTSLQVEVHIFGNSDQKINEEAIIFQYDDFKSRQQHKFLMKELQESITIAIERIADDPNDAIFLSDNQKQQSQKNEQEIIQNGNTKFGFLNQFISIQQQSEISETEQIETTLINGQKEKKLTKIETRNGIQTTKIEIKRENRQNDKSFQLQDEFLLYENPVIEEAEKFFGFEEEFLEEQLDNQNEKYNVFKNGVYLKNDNQIRNREVNKIQEESVLNLFNELITVGFIVIVIFFGYGAKEFIQKIMRK